MLNIDEHIQPKKICTVNEPSFEYPNDAVYEMEAHAFFAACARFCKPGFSQSVKIISDNKSNAPGNITKEKVKQWMSQKFDVLVPLIEQMKQLTKSVAPKRTESRNTK